MKWQIDTGEGFLRDAPDDAMGDMMGSGMALAKVRVFGGGQEKMWWMKCDLAMMRYSFQWTEDGVI